MSRWLAVSLVAVVLGAAGCPKAGGEYAETARQEGVDDRGETNGSMFDFVSDKPDGDDWQIRIRENSMWVSYSDGEDVEDLGTRALTEKETRRVWNLIDNCNIQERKKGKQNEETGTYQLKLRLPSDASEDVTHEEISVFISRETEDEDVVALTEYLQKLIGKYHPKYKKDKADF